MRANAEIATGVMHDSLPPVITTSEVSSRMRRAASPIACALAAQAVEMQRFGPGPAELHGDGARGRVRHHHRDEERAHPAGALLDVDRDLLLERDQPADAGAEDHRAARRIGAGVAGVGERVGRGRDTELRHAVDAARLLRPEIRRSGRSRALRSRSAPGAATGRSAGSSPAVERPLSSRDQNVSRSVPAGVFTPEPGDRDAGPPARVAAVGHEHVVTTRLW